MFRANTVVVVGAGASVEVGLPVGSELLKQIVQLTHITFDFSRQVSGDNAILQALRIILDEGGSVEKLNAHLEAGWQLGRSAKQAISIDNVIDALEDQKVELVGKLGIARAILHAESSSQKFKPNQEGEEMLDLSRFEDTWYSSLTKILTENVRKSSISELFNNLQIINFNYDRCLEQYLPYSLAEYYGVKPSEIREHMKTLIVHRPYGSVGKLPWQEGDAPSVSFGHGGPAQLAAVAQQIRTFTERVNEGAELAAMRDAIGQADRIIFLGFAFHRQNVELLAERVQNHTEILATAHGISKSDQSVIDDELSKAFQFDGTLNEGRIELAEATCHQLFKEFWRTITAEKSDREPIDFPQRF
jgi:hypothetical protein